MQYLRDVRCLALRSPQPGRYGCVGSMYGMRIHIASNSIIRSRALRARYGDIQLPGRLAKSYARRRIRAHLTVRRLRTFLYSWINAASADA